MKKTIVLTSILVAVIFMTSQNSFAQATPVSTWTNPLSGTPADYSNPRSTGTAGTGVHSNRRYVTNDQANLIMQYKNFGSRYLLILSQSQPDASGCRQEVWAWFSGIEGQDNNGRMVITHGPTRQYTVCPNRTNASHVNQAEVNMEIYRRWIVELSQNPSRYQNPQAWINQYTQLINQNRAWVNQIMP